MGYKVDFDALDTLCSQISQQAGGWKDQLEAVGNSINDLLVSDKITGQGAENIKSYFQSVHVVIMQSLLALLQSHAANCLMYKSDYQTNIDSSLHAVINSEELFDIRKELSFQRSNTWSVDSSIRSALTNISYLVSINLESSDTIDNTYATINRDLLNLESDITQLENSHLNSDFDGTQEMIASITALINEYLSTDKSAKSEYTPQQLADSEVYARLYLANEALKEEQSDKADELQLANEHETERLALLEEEEAQRREEEGWLNAVLAVGTIAIGAVAIVATWGAATPIVVTACVAGGSTIMYGTSNLVEAGQDIYYGSIGDIETVAFNPIRDTVFCGNQELYDIWGTVSTTVAGMIIPSGQAFAALRAAHPTAVLVATSAANGAISAGTSSVKQQFAETGSLGEINWGKVAMDTGVGGLVGGTTGAVGAGISNGATTLLSKSATISSLLNSESAVTRIATNFAIGGVSEVGSGMGTRFVGGMLTSGGDFKEAGMQAINPQNILFDAALGGTLRSFNGIEKPQQQSFADMMSPTDAEKHDKSFGCRGENGSYSVENQVQNNKDFFRPSWRQSELDAAQDFPDYQAQKSFVNGEEVPYGTKGSVRPDYYKVGHSVEIKNYNLESAKGRNSLSRIIEKQYFQRVDNLPEGTHQIIMVDIRGQNISDFDLNALYDDIMHRTNNDVTVLFKMQ